MYENKNKQKKKETLTLLRRSSSHEFWTTRVILEQQIQGGISCEETDWI